MLDYTLAYIDPGSGSLIIQVIIASVLAVPYFLRTQIGRAIGAIRGRSKPENLTQAAEADSSTPKPT